jgi:hypothetical protein
MARSNSGNIQNDDWSDPREYSINVNRTGEKVETKYSVLPSPAKPIPANILQAFKEKPINLEALFTEVIHSRRRAV